jgi:uncharacterized cupin superfamily protein
VHDGSTGAVSVAVQPAGSLIPVSDASGDAPEVFAKSVPSLTGSSSTGFWRTATSRATFRGASGSTDAKAASTGAMSVGIQAAGSLIPVSDASGDAPEVFAKSVPSLTGSSSTGFWRTATGSATFSGASGSTDAKAASTRAMSNSIQSAGFLSPAWGTIQNTRSLIRSRSAGGGLAETRSRTGRYS